jgi:hypothetical protein
MHPLSAIDVSQFDASTLVHPLWEQGERLYLRVYLSTYSRITSDFFQAGYPMPKSRIRDDLGENAAGEESSMEAHREMEAKEDGNTIMLWDEKVNAPAFSKSFLLTICQNKTCEEGPSYVSARARLEQCEHSSLELEQGVLSVMSAAGHGIESTSILLTFYQSLYSRAKAVLSSLNLISVSNETSAVDGILERQVVKLSHQSPIWSSLVRSNSSLFLHVLVLRANAIPSQQWPPPTADDLHNAVVSASRSNAFLAGQVELVKFDVPNHLRKPSRILYHDLVYMWKRFVSSAAVKKQHPPWIMEYSSPEQYRDYVEQTRMKREGSKYPYWKPEVSIKYVTDLLDYPSDYVGLSGMPVVRLASRTEKHPTGYSFTPAIHVDEIGLTSEKYIPVNSTLTSLPLRISFDRSDVEHKTSTATVNTGTAGGISPARWRLLSHLSQALESQRALGFEDSDIDEVRRLIAETNVNLLMITLLASALHMLFEFLTFKNEVTFWRQNQDLTGLSVRSLFLDMAGQTIILLYLIEQDSSLLITVPSAIGCLIALWKCHRAAGLRLERLDEGRRRSVPTSWWNALPRMLGYEFRATRLEVNDQAQSLSDDSKGSIERYRLAGLTLEADRIATRTLGVFLLPLVVGYTTYQWIYIPHIGWYSWLVTSASSAVYALGFVLMTPQLFLNWKLKSVAHLPWRVLVYKSLNTFIDDLFSFIIRMPAMARISCFRDDVVFFIYLYQRWLYPVDDSRPVEGGVGEGAIGWSEDNTPRSPSETKKNR